MNDGGPAYLAELLISKKAPRMLQSAELYLLEILNDGTEIFGNIAFRAAEHSTCSSLPLHINEHHYIQEGSKNLFLLNMGFTSKYLFIVNTVIVR